MSTSQTNDIQALFQAQVNEGTLSGASLQALRVHDIGQQIAAGLGIHVDDVTSSEVTLLNVLVDDSGSISACGNVQLVRDSVNALLDALNQSRDGDAVLCQIRLLNGRVINPYRRVTDAVRLDARNYDQGTFGGTPLYDETMVLLATVLAKTQEFADNGVPARSISLIVTDGEDCHSKHATTRQVARVVKDLTQQEVHIVAAFGIPGNSNADFRKVFNAMGIDDRWILTPQPGKTLAETQKNIRAAFCLFSQSAVRASQSAGNFSQLAGGGFGG